VGAWGEATWPGGVPDALLAPYALPPAPSRWEGESGRAGCARHVGRSPTRSLLGVGPGSLIGFPPGESSLAVNDRLHARAAIPRHRRRRLHRQRLGAPALERERGGGGQPRQAHLCRQSGVPRRLSRPLAPPLCPRRHLRRGAGRRSLARPAARRHLPPRGGVPRRSLHRRPRAVHRDQCGGHLHPLGGGPRLLARPARGRTRPLPFPACLHRRGVRFPWREGGLHGGECLCAELAVCCLQGGIGPPGAGVLPDLRPAGGDHQLLEQLRAVPISREAHPPGDPQRPGGQAPADLR